MVDGEHGKIQIMIGGAMAMALVAAALQAALHAGGTPAAEPARGEQSRVGSAVIPVYVGTYTGGKSKGIYLCHLDRAAGRLLPATLAAKIVNPSYLAIHPNRTLVYAVGETSEFASKKTGTVSVFSIDPASGKLTLLNQQSSAGAGPCYVSIDRNGRWALVANYVGGSVACLPLGEDGRLGEAASVVQHQAPSVNAAQKQIPHAHSIDLDAANRFAVVSDLGLDKVMVYRFDVCTGRLIANDPAFTAVAPGSGPRHFVFHPDGRYAYVINERASTVTAFGYDGDRATLTPLQTISTLPEGFTGQNFTAEVQVHPSGKFLYGSNRGHDSIAAFGIDGTTGKLRPIGHTSTQGKTPRHFAVDPSGAYLIAANQASDSLVLFRIDGESGRLRATGSSIEVGSPVCVVWMK